MYPNKNALKLLHIGLFQYLHIIYYCCDTTLEALILDINVLLFIPH